MRSRRWLYACAAVMFALASSEGFALQGNGHGRDKHGDHDDDDRGGYVYNDHDRDVCGTGMTTITTASRLVSPSGISCRPVWRNNSWCAAHSHRGCGRKFNVARKTLNSGYRLRRQIANTSSSTVTSFF